VFRRVLIAPIVVYQRVISPLLPRRCRFHPTCSQYAIEAITEHGAARGGWLALVRLLKCHPLHPGGYDPVPPGRPRRGAGGRDPARTRSGPPKREENR